MGNEEGEKPKKAIRRKPLWLMVPVGQRQVERAEGLVEDETLYTMEQFTSVTDLRKNLEARELDQTNVKGILLFRADAIPVETKLKAQVVIKFGHEEEGEV
jgi:hypothetical protein